MAPRVKIEEPPPPVKVRVDLAPARPEGFSGGGFFADEPAPRGKRPMIDPEPPPAPRKLGPNDKPPQWQEPGAWDIPLPKALAEPGRVILRDRDTIQPGFAARRAHDMAMLHQDFMWAHYLGDAVMASSRLIRMIARMVEKPDDPELIELAAIEVAEWESFMGDLANNTTMRLPWQDKERTYDDKK